MLYRMATLLMTLSDPLLTQTTTISTFCVDFHIFVAGNCRDFKFVMCLERSKFQPTDDKPSL